MAPGGRDQSKSAPPTQGFAPQPGKGGDELHGHGGHTMQPNPTLPAAGAATQGAATYVCPMHPEVTSAQPGRCPKCNMKLVAKQ